MKRFMLTAMLILVAQASGYSYWNSIRYSALLPDQTVLVRVENPFGSQIYNYLLYDDGGVEEVAMESVADGPSTVAATVPGSSSSASHYGFRLLQPGDELDLMPVILPAGTPAPDDLCHFVDDPVGDELFGFNNLDLTACATGFSDTRIYASLTNAGGGFPVNQGLTFFGYVFGLTDPDNAVPDTVYAMIYTIDQPGIISPGLYRITGTGMGDLEKIGDIETEIFSGDNTLLLSCQLSDLLSEPGFSSWFDPVDRRVAIAAFTQKITLLGGAQEADGTDGGDCYLRDFSIDPGTNQLPAIANPLFQGTGSQATVSIDYTDPDGNCPVISEIVFDNSSTYPLYPVTLDYGSTVIYRSDEGIQPLATGNWGIADFRFSDNISDVVELQVFHSGINEAQGTALLLALSPNPSRGALSITVDMPEPGRAILTLYDTAGRSKIKVFEGILGSGESTMSWHPEVTAGSHLPPGAYFLSVEAVGTLAVRKVLLLP